MITSICGSLTATWPTDSIGPSAPPATATRTPSRMAARHEPLATRQPSMHAGQGAWQWQTWRYLPHAELGELLCERVCCFAHLSIDAAQVHQRGGEVDRGRLALLAWAVSVRDIEPPDALGLLAFSASMRTGTAAGARAAATGPRARIASGARRASACIKEEWPGTP